MNISFILFLISSIISQEEEQVEPVLQGAELRKKKRDDFNALNQSEIEAKREKIKAYKEKRNATKGKKAAELLESKKKNASIRRQERKENLELVRQGRGDTSLRSTERINKMSNRKKKQGKQPENIEEPVPEEPAAEEQ